MPRQTTRKIERSPGGHHVTVKRDDTGTVQFVSEGSGTVTVDNTAEEVLATVDDLDPNLVAFEDVTLEIPASELSTTEVPLDLVLYRDGAEVASLNHTDETTDATLNHTETHDPPTNAPTYEIAANVDGGSADLDYDVTREDHWV